MSTCIGKANLMYLLITILREMNQTYLDIVFNKKLDWNNHFQSCNRIYSSRLYALRVLKPILSKSELATVYISLIRSIVDYGFVTTCHLTNYCNTIVRRIERRAHNLQFLIFNFVPINVHLLTYLIHC